MYNIYRDVVLDHYKNPRNFGKISQPDFSAKKRNILCGDSIEITGNLEKSKIKDIKFTGKGCVVSQASASLLTDYVRGKPESFIEKLSVKDLVELLGVSLSPMRMRCAELSLSALKKALKFYAKSKQKLN
jgi:nitrogen fixation NifU-like protein